MADLDTIMSERENDSPAPEQNAPAPAEQQPVETEGQPRDSQGRFAPTAQEQADAQTAEQAGQQPEAQRPPDGYVPIQALDARLAKQQERFEAQLREREAQWQRQLAMFAPQPKPEPVKRTDFYENPDAAFDERLSQAVQPIAQGQQAIVENFSRMMAADKYGEEAVNAARAELEARFQSNPRAAMFDHQRIMASPHPYGELVKWHKAQSALATYGDDPTAYREKLRAEIAAEMNGGRPPQPPTAPATDPSQLPTSFAQSRNAGRAATSQTWSGPRPLSEIKPT